MVQLAGYQHFIGRHWETGSVCNYYASRGVTAPHTGKPYSEALLMGVSGGIVFGYFSFAYRGYDPHVAILTRNTFDPLDTLLQRLGVEQENLQTSDPARGRANLIKTLESGLPAIVWADIFSLPYIELPNDGDMYLMYPILVYGYDEAQDAVMIADRSRVGLQVTPAQLARARARVKKDKFRVLTLGNPDPHKLPAAVSQGIEDTLRLFSGKPPKGSPENFGFAAYRRWGNLLLNPKLSNSWASVFPPGRAMLAGLTSAFFSIQPGGGDAERSRYADFLDEAGQILNRPELSGVGREFRGCAAAWADLGASLLPDEIQPFGEIRRLIQRRGGLFLERGGAAKEEIAQINRQIGALEAAAAADFPLDSSGVQHFLEQLAEKITMVRDLEFSAVQHLQEAVAA